MLTLDLFPHELGSVPVKLLLEKLMIPVCIEQRLRHSTQTKTQKHQQHFLITGPDSAVLNCKGYASTPTACLPEIYFPMSPAASLLDYCLTNQSSPSAEVNMGGKARKQGAQATVSFLV